MLTPEWQPGEVIVERYEIPIAFDAASGRLRFEVGLQRLDAPDKTCLHPVPLQKISIAPAQRVHVELPMDAVANFNAQIALLGATANGTPAGAATAPELPTITAKPGETIEVWLNWFTQQQVDESYTVFMHLIDGNNQLHAQQDYTPMGGAFPTQLWIPKWIAGQSVHDPYQIKVPADLPPGEYFIETGMYGMTSQRRVPIIGRDGGLAGDRAILFKVKVQPK